MEKLLKDQIKQMTDNTYSLYKRIMELKEENTYLKEKVNKLEDKLEQLSERKLNESWTYFLSLT